MYVSGHRLDEPYVVRRAPWVMSELTLSPDEYFVAGDNRGMPMQSHTLGAAKRQRIIGRVVL
ncbi:MAG: hypothetical protein HYX76_16160 [Acidobacteria bacterium]|nr:hypothetical protein [Acidobacteriota bacterium]